MLDKAIKIAVAAHEGQVDKSGRPYILHPLQLMMQMGTEEEMVTAVLHDVVEDSDMTLADLAAAGFSEVVVTAVGLLTHDKSRQSYEEYVTAVKANPLARRVKLADLTHNMDARRLENIDEKALQRLQKYHRAWKLLQDI
jgi:(p)ppGpp synthase/HD superfamily hydrolase